MESKVGDNGLFFVVDLCITEKELEGVKETLLKVVSQLPQNIYVGLLCFNRNVFLFDFEEDYVKFACLSGKEGNS